jgi:hypothetical protein
MLSHRDPDPDAVVGTIVDAPIHTLPCIEALTSAGPYLRRQGVAAPAVAGEGRPPEYARNWDRLVLRFGGEVLVPPAYRGENVNCGRCFTALPAEHANRIRTGNAHAVCQACGRIVLPVEFRNEHVLKALSTLAGSRAREVA